VLSRLFGKKKLQVIDRNGERHDVIVGVMSRELPGYKAITIDISQSGVQLQTTELLEIGLEPVLAFDFDRAELKNFSCKARVVWSRQVGDNRSKFNSGLTFVPESDEDIINLSRMATILQVRSEADIRTLLDEANRVDPERAAVYSNALMPTEALLSTSPPPAPAAPAAAPAAAENPYATVSPAGAAPVAPAPPTASTPNAASPAAPGGSTPAPHPGVYIPLNVTIDSYDWSQQARTLQLTLLEAGTPHTLYFPECQLFRDEGCGSSRPVSGLFSTFTSQAKDRLALGPDRAEWKHYRFIASDGTPLIDIVSKACRSTRQA
jgi:hypothetical protein